MFSDPDDHPKPQHRAWPGWSSCLIPSPPPLPLSSVCGSGFQPWLHTGATGRVLTNPRTQTNYRGTSRSSAVPVQQASLTCRAQQAMSSGPQAQVSNGGERDQFSYPARSNCSLVCVLPFLPPFSQPLPDLLLNSVFGQCVLAAFWTPVASACSDTFLLPIPATALRVLLPCYPFTFTWKHRLPSPFPWIFMFVL